MNDVMLFHVVKWNQKLNCKSSNKANWNTLEVVALDELVEIHTQKFKWKNQMLSENEFFFNSDDVLLILGVTVTELLKNFSFNQPLLV